MSAERWPPVGVVVPTKGRRRAELRRALGAIASQDYPAPVHVMVVFDGTDPDERFCAERVRAVPNTRTPGLAGARNTGILSLETTLVAFCDDDDEWLPNKLTAQVARLIEADADVATTASVIVTDEGRATTRHAGMSRVTHPQLLRSRMAMIPSSTFVIRRDALLNYIGLVDESIPGGEGEDWDLLLRASKARPIAHVDEPLVRVARSSESYFTRAWETKVSSLRWFLKHHPELSRDARAAARIYGQLAFAHAALGQRRCALKWSAKALVRCPVELRPYVAAAVAVGLASADGVLDTLHRRGRGI